MSGKIDFTRSGLTEKTTVESDHTRDRVHTTLMVMNQIKEEMLQEINQVKENIVMTTSNISNQIESTHSGLNETTLTQSNQTREKVDETAELVNVVKESLANTKQELKEEMLREISQVKENIVMTTSNLSNQIESTHSGLNEITLTQSSQTHEKVDKTAELVNVLKEDLANTKRELATVSLCQVFELFQKTSLGCGLIYHLFLIVTVAYPRGGIYAPSLISTFSNSLISRRSLISTW